MTEKEIADLKRQNADLLSANNRYLARARTAEDALQPFRYMLHECGQQFRFYQRQHEAKKTPEANEKAKVNEKLADRIEALLAGEG